MTEFHCRKSLWARIIKLAQSCKGPRWVATPYLGRVARFLLPLKGGDKLICAMTESHVRSGGVCPEEVKKLQGQGVKVYTQDSIHAKIYLLGNIAIVCSANLSKNSVHNLDEAGMLTDDPSMVGKIRQWFNERFSTLVTPGWIEHMMPLYVPSEHDSTTSDNVSDGAKKDTTTGRVWLGIIRDTTFPKNEEKYLKACEIAAAKRISDTELYSVMTTRWLCHPELKFGDHFIQVYKEDEEWWVMPHARILEVVDFKTPTGRPRAYVSKEMPDYDDCPTYNSFQEQCAKVGLKLDTDPEFQDMVEIKVPSHARCALKLSLFDPDALGE